MALYKRRVRALTVLVIIAVFVGLPCIIILSQNPALLRFQYEVSRGFQFLLGKEVEGRRREPPWRETLKQVNVLALYALAPNKSDLLFAAAAAASLTFCFSDV